MLNVIKLLKNNKEISDYKVIETSVSSYELFFVLGKLETVRSTNTSSSKVTVYKDHDSFRGNASFTLLVNDTKEEVESKISNAIETASLINNEYYSLPSDESLDVTLDTNFEDYDPKELGAKIYETVESTCKGKAKFNACEIFINKRSRHIVTNADVDKKEISYDAMIELIPTYDIKGNGDSVELYKAITFSFFDEKKLTKTIKQSLKDVTARAKAVKPSKSIVCPIMLRSDEIGEIVMQYASNLSYEALYSKYNLFNKGDKIQKDAKYDKLNVSVCGKLPYSSKSHAFDDDGIDLSKVKVIKDGVAHKNYGSNQFAQYLKKKPTGNLRLIELKKGSYSEKELKAEPYLECVSFSGLQVDLENDYIGGEVRLANYFDGKKIVPLTGISISGKLSEVINTIKLSNKLTYDSNYKGPNLALFEGFKIY